MSIDEIYRRMNDDTEAPEIDLSKSKVREFFAGKTILLSGATGYVGKVFIEKILRDCPQLERLYVLVREKKGVAPEDKMKRYFEHTIFEKLRTVNPNFSSQVTTITGDLQEDKLGLSPDDRRLLAKNLDIIVHTGATTKFDERVSIALKINALGTKNMLDLAMDCEKIQAFVHVSTGYSHCYRRDIEETFYESPADIEKVHELIARDEADDIGLGGEALKKVLGKWPNVYVYSKAVAEGLVKQYGDRADFAVAVFRPTIIIAARKEPVPGWVNSNNGLTLIFVGIGLGILHVIYHDNDRPLDMIPVDLTVNALIAVIHDAVQRWKFEKKPMVYNYGSRMADPVKMDQTYKWLLVEIPKIGTTHSFWHPFIFQTHNPLLFWFFHLLFHLVPAVLTDIVLMCMMKKPKAVKLFSFVSKNLSSINYFSDGDWRIRSDNTLALYDRLNETDQTIFNFDVKKLDWEFMTMLYLRGTRLYVLKESLDNLAVSKRRYRRMKILHYVVATFVLLLIACFMMKLFVYACDFYARKEPLPDYANKNNMLKLTFMGVALGVLHAIYHDTNSIVGMIPVDRTVNALVDVVNVSVEQWKVTKKPAVYNFGSRILVSFYFFPPTCWRLCILNAIFYFLPALVADVVLICMRKEPKMFFFVTKNMSAIDLFGNKDWQIHINKTLELYDRLNETYQTIFNFDVRKLDWKFMTVLYTRGAKLYVLNESMNNLN